jgi:hypothetical protein
MIHNLKYGKYEVVMAKDINSRCGRRPTPVECYDGEPF